MARKRGGLAGLWDRKKQYIVPAATGLAGIFGGPLAGAALGAAMRGADKRSLKSAALGGLEGAAMGKLGAGVGAKLGIGAGSRQAVSNLGAKAGGSIKGLFAPKAAASAAPDMTRTAMGAGMDLPGLRVTAPEIGALAKPAAERSFLGSAASAVGSGVGKVAKTIQEYPKAAEMILGALPSPETDIRERQAAVQEGELALQRQQFDEMMRRQRMQEEREALIAQLFSPILQRRLAESNSTTMARG
jgi:hypothetical protein